MDSKCINPVFIIETMKNPDNIMKWFVPEDISIDREEAENNN